MRPIQSCTHVLDVCWTSFFGICPIDPSELWFYLLTKLHSLLTSTSICRLLMKMLNKGTSKSLWTSKPISQMSSPHLCFLIFMLHRITPWIQTACSQLGVIAFSCWLLFSGWRQAENGKQWWLHQRQRKNGSYVRRGIAGIPALTLTPWTGYTTFIQLAHKTFSNVLLNLWHTHTHKTKDEGVPTEDAASTYPIDGHIPSVGPQMKRVGVLVLPAAQSQKGCSQSKSPPSPSLHLLLDQLLGVPKFKVDIIQKEVAFGVNSC